MYSYDDDDATAEVPENDNSSKRDQKTAITAAAAGTVGLGLAAVAMSKIFEDGTGADENAVTNNETGTASAAVAESVTPPPVEISPTLATETLAGATLDSTASGGVPTGSGTATGQTFDEAFAAARAEMGLGHYFQFEGKTYNTYYVQEWEQLSPHEKQDFLATVPGSGVSPSESNHSMVADTSIPQSLDNQETSTEDVLTRPNPERVNEADIILEDDDHNSSLTSDKTEVVIAEMDGEDIVVVDSEINHADDPLNTDNNVLIDTDTENSDAIVVVDTENHPETNLENFQEQITIDHETEILSQPNSGGMIAGNDPFDLGSDFDNHADISDLDYT